MLLNDNILRKVSRSDDLISSVSVIVFLLYSLGAGDPRGSDYVSRLTYVACVVAGTCICAYVEFAYVLVSWCGGLFRIGKA